MPSCVLYFGFCELSLFSLASTPAMGHAMAHAHPRHRTHSAVSGEAEAGQTAPSITQHFIDRTLPASSHQFAGVFLPYSGCRAQRVIHCEDLRSPPADTLSECGSGWAA